MGADWNREDAQAGHSQWRDRASDESQRMTNEIKWRSHFRSSRCCRKNKLRTHIFMAHMLGLLVTQDNEMSIIRKEKKKGGVDIKTGRIGSRRRYYIPRTANCSPIAPILQT